jgi:hypothetical protein
MATARHSFLEIVAKSGQKNSSKIRRKNANLMRKMKKQKFNIQSRKNVGDIWLF